MIEPQTPRPFIPKVHDRVSRAGEWRRDGEFPLDEHWEFGTIFALSSREARIVDERGNVVLIPTVRMTWSAAQGEWMCWSARLDAAVREIERHESAADAHVAKQRLLKSPVLGSFVLCSLGAKAMGGFLVRMIGGGYVVNLPKNPECFISRTMLTFDDSMGCWRADYRARQES